jgi:site-specific DNA recombinase
MAEHTIDVAFWGRVSTEDNQDPASSRGWQLTRAKALVGPHGGRIVTEFFDVDKSRSIPPQRRPQAAALLAALADPQRGFDAVVVGEPQRAFYGNQFGNTFPIFAHYGVPLWVPEVGGPIDPDNEAHDLIMSVFGGVSKGERNRIKIRVRTAMTAQAQIEGRFLGGRPPYGYKLADAGPHPNPAKAADGKRLHTLAIDEPAAENVRRIFAEFAEGFGIYAIAERLTADGIPCPSAHDPARNPHRCGLAWSKSAVRTILANPRYTGRQVWNKQRKDEVLLDVNDVALGHVTKMRWNDDTRWIYSEQIVHPPIIDDQTFGQARLLLAAKNARQVIRRPRATPRAYPLRGLLFCGICDRRMQGSWNNEQAYYRCTFPAQYARTNQLQHPRAVYLRATSIMLPLDEWFAGVFRPERLPATITDLTAAQVDEPHADIEKLRQQLAETDRQLASYRAALDAGGDPAVVSAWITESQARKLATSARLGALRGSRPGRLTQEEISAMVSAISDIVSLLSRAEAADKAELYAQLGLRLTYHPGQRTVTARAEVGRICTNGSCPRGDLNHPPIRCCSRLSSRRGAGRDRASRQVDQSHHGRMRRDTRANRRNCLLPAYAPAGRDARPAGLGGHTNAVVGGRDDCCGVHHAAGGVAVRQSGRIVTVGAAGDRERGEPRGQRRRCRADNSGSSDRRVAVVRADRRLRVADAADPPSGGKCRLCPKATGIGIGSCSSRRSRARDDGQPGRDSARDSWDGYQAGGVAMGSGKQVGGRIASLGPSDRHQVWSARAMGASGQAVRAGRRSRRHVKRLSRRPRHPASMADERLRLVELRLMLT